MALLRAVLWILLLPMGATSIAAAFLLFDRDAWLERNRIWHLVSSIVLMLPGLCLAYALLVDWSSLSWVGLSFLLILIVGAIEIKKLLHEQGISWSTIRLQRRLGLQKARTAETLKPREIAMATHLADASMGEQRDRPTVMSAQRTWWPSIWILKWIVGAEVGLWLLGLLAASRVTFPGYGSFVLFLLGLAIAAHYSERFLSARIELSSVHVSPLFAHRTGTILFMVGNCFVAIVALNTMADAWRFVLVGAPQNTAAIALVWGLGVALAMLGRALTRFEPLKAASQVLQNDVRRPVLYLRSFVRDSASIATHRRRMSSAREAWAGMRLVGLVVLAAYAELTGRDVAQIESKMDSIADSQTAGNMYGNVSASNVAHTVRSGGSIFVDEQLLLANLFNQIGPYIAIAQPRRGIFRRTGFEVGSARMQVPDANWQWRVLGLIRMSSLVIVEAGHSTGLLWEITQVVAHAAPRKVLLILPDHDEKQYSKFCSDSLSVFPIQLPPYSPDLRFVMFNDDWKPVPLLGRTALKADVSVGVRYATVLQPFFERNGFAIELA